MRAGADPARYVAVAQFQRVLGELNQMRVERANERAERAVDDAIKAGKLIPAQRQWALQASGRWVCPHFPPGACPRCERS